MYHHKISLNHFPMAICNKLPGGIPSGKHTKNYGKSAFLMGKSTISMAIFNSYVCLPMAICFSIIYGIILPINWYFSRWLKPPTRCIYIFIGCGGSTTKQLGLKWQKRSHGAGLSRWYPSGILQQLLLKMAVEFVDLPIKNDNFR